jgi:tRNA(Ile)-lysidine synthase
MITILGKIPRDVYLAVSGGHDSMCVLNFLINSHNVSVLHFNHNTEHSNQAEEFVTDFCLKNNIRLFTKKNNKNKPLKKSFEEFWREQRYEFLSNFTDKKIITAHHLNDVVEWWIFSSLNGQSKLINYSRGNIIRPFLPTSKKDFEHWKHKRSVLFIDDPSNKDVKYARNRIRQIIMPEILQINPGIFKTIKKKVLERFANDTAL